MDSIATSKNKENAIENNFSLHNKFNIEVKNAETGEIIETAKAYNVVLDQFWTAYRNTFNFSSIGLSIGTGSGTPRSSDTALFTPLGSIRVTDNLTYDFSHLYIGKYYTISGSVVLGVNTYNDNELTEVGICGYRYNSNVWYPTGIISHAMFEDMNGNPITITKDSTKIITITATIYIHINLTQSSSLRIAVPNIDKGGSSSPYYAITYLINGGSPYLSCNRSGTVNDSINGPNMNTPSSDRKTWSGSTSFGVNDMNYSDDNGYIRDLYIANTFYLPYASAFNINNFAIQNESIATCDGTQSSFRTKFPINSLARIYVNGVEQVSGLTVLRGFTWNAVHDFLSITEHGAPQFRSLEELPITFYFDNYDRVYFSKLYLGFALGWSTTASVPTTISLYESSDLTTWTLIDEVIDKTVTYRSGSSAVYEEIFSFSSRNSRYIKLSVTPSSSGGYSKYCYIKFWENDNNIIFNTPPAAGSVITADYIPDCIPKDTDHTMELAMSYSLGVYSGNQ